MQTTNDTSKPHQFITVDDIASGRFKGYAHNLADLTDICESSQRNLRHAVYYEENLKRVIRKCENTINMTQDRRVIREFTIGKSFANSKNSEFKANEPTTWKLSGGFTSRWQGYKNKGYHGLVVLACIDKDAIHETYKSKVDCQLYTLALEQSLIKHYLFVAPDKRLANESLDNGYKWKNEGEPDERDGKNDIIYIAFQFKDDPVPEQTHSGTESHGKVTESPKQNFISKTKQYSSQSSQSNAYKEGLSRHMSKNEGRNQQRGTDKEGESMLQIENDASSTLSNSDVNTKEPSYECSDSSNTYINDKCNQYSTESENFKLADNPMKIATIETHITPSDSDFDDSKEESVSSLSQQQTKITHPSVSYNEIQSTNDGRGDNDTEDYTASADSGNDDSKDISTSVPSKRYTNILQPSASRNEAETFNFHSDNNSKVDTTSHIETSTECRQAAKPSLTYDGKQTFNFDGRIDETEGNTTLDIVRSKKHSQGAKLSTSYNKMQTFTDDACDDDSKGYSKPIPPLTDCLNETIGPRKEQTRTGSDECYICGHGKGRSKECSSCGKIYHIECYVPKLESIPEESDWKCLLCIDIDTLVVGPKEPAEQSSSRHTRSTGNENGISTKQIKVCQRLLLEIFCHCAYSKLRDSTFPQREKWKRTDFKILTDKLTDLRSKLEPQHFNHFQTIESFTNELQGVFENRYEEASLACINQLKKVTDDLIQKLLPVTLRHPIKSTSANQKRKNKTLSPTEKAKKMRHVTSETSERNEVSQTNLEQSTIEISSDEDYDDKE